MKYNEFRIAVIGDVMLDVWNEAKEVRTSPEAPVLDVINPVPTFTPGGAANVAGSLVVQKPRTGTVSAEELHAAL